MTFDNLTRFCSRGKFPANCEICACEDKYMLEIDTVANTSHIERCLFFDNNDENKSKIIREPKRVIYDEYMDKECIPLCDALNELPEVRTFESCCGHCKTAFLTYLYCKSWYSMSVIARAFDRRYSNTEQAYTINLETIDASHDPQFCIYLSSEKAYENNASMERDVANLVNNIKYWSSPNFFDYFHFNC